MANRKKSAARIAIEALEPNCNTTIPLNGEDKHLVAQRISVLVNDIHNVTRRTFRTERSDAGILVTRLEP